MKSFRIIDAHNAQLEIDTSLFSKSVVTKVLYWLNNNYTVMLSCDDNIIKMELECVHGHDWDKVKKDISTMLSDYQMRELIEQETRDIRNILYVKAFANVDELTDYSADKDVI